MKGRGEVQTITTLGYMKGISHQRLVKTQNGLSEDWVTWEFREVITRDFRKIKIFMLFLRKIRTLLLIILCATGNQSTRQKGS